MMNNKLFVYGSLMAPEVVQTLLRRMPSKIQDPAFIHGFTRHPVRGCAFPGLVRSLTPSSRVEGLLFEDLTVKDMEILDWFEDEAYEKIVVDVHVQGDNSVVGSVVQALVYLWSHPLEELDVDSSWCYRTFREQKLSSYIDDTVQPCRDELDDLHSRGDEEEKLD